MSSKCVISMCWLLNGRDEMSIPLFPFLFKFQFHSFFTLSLNLVPLDSSFGCREFDIMEVTILLYLIYIYLKSYWGDCLWQQTGQFPVRVEEDESTRKVMFLTILVSMNERVRENIDSTRYTITLVILHSFSENPPKTLSLKRKTIFPVWNSSSVTTIGE